MLSPPEGCARAPRARTRRAFPRLRMRFAKEEFPALFFFPGDAWHEKPAPVAGRVRRARTPPSPRLRARASDYASTACPDDFPAPRTPLCAQITVKGDGSVSEDKFAIKASAGFAKGGTVSLTVRPGWKPST